MGGVWTLILAERPEDIEVRYPELTIVEEPPGTMTIEEFERIRRERSPVDLDDEHHPFLKRLRETRRDPS